MALVVLIAPGALLLGCFDLGRRIPALLIPASALSLSLVPIGLITVVRLQANWPIGRSVAACGGILSVLAVFWVWRCAARKAAGTTGATPLVGQILASPVSWMRHVPAGLIVLTAGVGFIALLSGERYFADGDSYFHAAIALKLQSFMDPSFWNIGQYRGGDNHPGYALPLWHEAIAVIARLADSSALETMRLLPVVLAPISVLTFAGVAQIAFRSGAAATAAAVAFVGGRMVFTFPAMDGIYNAAEPRTVASGILLPLVLGLVLLVVGRPNADEVGISATDAGSAAAWKPATALAVCATVVLVYVHVSYIVWLALLLLGVAAVALPLGWKTPELRRAQLAAGGAVFAAAVVSVATLLPAIGRLQDHPEGGTKGGLALASANVDALLVGSGSTLHLRADYIIWFGAVAFLGLAGTALLGRWLRDPLVGWIPVASTIACAFVLIPPAFRWLAESIGVAQTTRVYLIIPWVFGAAALVLIVGGRLDAWWKCGGRRRWASVGALLGLALGTMWLANVWPPLKRRSAPAVMPPDLVTALIVLCAVGCVIAVLVYRVQPGWLGGTGPWQHRGLGVAATTIVLALAPLPILLSQADRVQHTIATGPLSGTAVPGTAAVDVRTRRTLARVMRSRPHPVVLAEPHLAYRMLALSPVYAAAVPPGHVAITKRNRPYDRNAAIETFLIEGTSAATRLSILNSQRVDVVVLRARADKDAIRFASEHPQYLTRLGYSRNLYSYLVRRDELQRAV
jgi:hypothetical protein